MAITVQTQKNMSGIAHKAQGALRAGNVDVDFATASHPTSLILNLGFKPSYFRITNVTAGSDAPVHATWLEGMASGFYILEVAAGDKTYVNTDLLVVHEDGTVEIDITDPAFLTNDDLVIWEARG